ncbi:MAG: 16S rRNA (adenine(1518)-N(6)/adenine(1519)-N(6))-dimethyltransferase RsmA [Clostridiales bacterium]|nr:16S rRNA (adenine(1518)-N(6)/adenine(1519)-N(6))-dimethyltransferase RsmA [Clostridiales bacterium]
MNNLTNLNILKDILHRHGFSFSKGLGQNFLINSSVCPRIAEMGNAKEGYGIIEIGTGVGTLTAELARRADKVVAIEIDSRLLPILEETLHDFDNIKIINKDILEVDIVKLIEEEFGGMNVAVCANLPYYITSPIIMFLLESMARIDSITVMVQKEAAQRLCAEVGTRQSGAITVGVKYYGEAKLLFNVSRGSFMPAPKVDSSVIRIDINNDKRYGEIDESFFFRIVRAGFSQRRKTLANSISSTLGISKDIIFEVLLNMGINQAARIEELAMNELIILSESIKKSLN